MSQLAAFFTKIQAVDPCHHFLPFDNKSTCGNHENRWLKDQISYSIQIPRDKQFQYNRNLKQRVFNMSVYSSQHQEISIREIPKFQFQLRNEELINCIKELTFNMKNQQKNIQKIKKDIEVRTTESQITETLVYINSLIEIDPTLGKQLKSKQNSKKQELANNPINNSSGDLGRKINQISQTVTILSTGLRSLEKKVSDLEYTSKSTLNQKTNALQQQIDENNTKYSNEFSELKQKLQLMNAGFGDKVREVETKTLWQINDCKLRLNSCVNDQYVKDSMKQLEGKMSTKMKEELIRQGSIDPERITKIQQNILKNEKEFASQMTQTNYKIQVLKQNIEKSLLSKKQFGDEKIDIQKRFNLLNTNISDAVRRIRASQSQISDQKQKVKKLENFSETSTKQVNRMNSVLNNLKIGDDFQKMLEKIDPHKICQLDTRVDDVTLNQQKIVKTLDLARKQIDRLRSKTQFCNILTPNTGGPGTKFNKEQIDAIVHEYFTNNLFAKKLQTLQSQFLEVKAFPEMINSINKNIARMQKQTDNHNISYELKGLQEYVKKQILIVNNRINNIEIMLNEDKRKRPQSAGKNVTNQKLGSSVSFKKLTPVNCISCYPSPSTGESMNLNLKKTIMRKL